MLLDCFVDLLFLLEVFCAPNFIFECGFRGGLFLDAAVLVGDLRVVFLGDVLVDLFAGIIWLRGLFWGKTGQF